MSYVSLVKISQGEAPVGQAISQSLNLINYSFPSDVRHVVIKPNLCYYWDATTGQTTSPAFVSTLIDLIREKAGSDVDIAIVESDASAMRCKYAFRMLGYEQLAAEKNVRLVNLSEDQSSSVEVSCNGSKYNFNIPRTISGADLKINIAHIKYTVDPIKLTCALKNIFGCNPYQKKYKYHSDLGNVIVALNKAMPFDLCLIDNNIATGVQPRRLGLVMASEDPVALDVVASKIAWLNPEKIPYFEVAEREGVGQRGYVAVGAELDFFRELYPKVTLKMKAKRQVKRGLVGVGLGKRLGLE
ncbi:MAG TPA: DUF362 domain-containing protein [Candidatus Acidoferrales bacterium]|nr:DUF362 domain-containing protein [Candidatus Acidoferrales bacterium]